MSFFIVSTSFHYLIVSEYAIGSFLQAIHKKTISAMPTVFL
ncbi:hypothetical protein X559_1041 [Paenilisteria newyorkensis]|nr:hypothetical protein X559_1041 [Listeria newyorkensis]